MTDFQGAITFPRRNVLRVFDAIVRAQSGRISEVKSSRKRGDPESRFTLLSSYCTVIVAADARSNDFILKQIKSELFDSQFALCC